MRAVEEALKELGMFKFSRVPTGCLLDTGLASELRRKKFTHSPLLHKVRMGKKDGN